MIELQQLTKKYGGHTIFENINLTLENGHIYGFVGRNGSGKSVLFNTICGFSKPTSGRVLKDGIDLYAKDLFLPDARALINRPKFIEDLSGYENLKLLASLTNKIGTQEIEEILKKVGLFEEGKKAYKKYSLGMKQKLGIAQVLMESPNIIILDEPMNGLDKQSMENLRIILQEEKKKGRLILLATHVEEDIRQLCDIVYLIEDGTIKELVL